MPIVVLMLMAADCGAWVEWRLDVEGEHGRVRALDTPSGGRTASFPGAGLYDLPTSFGDKGLGSTSVPHILLAAVPDCGYEFVQWTYRYGGGIERDPLIRANPGSDWATPGRVAPRVLEASFSPSTVARNDCFETPHELTLDGLTSSSEFENVTAGVEADEPVHGGPSGSAGASVWWTFDAPDAGVLRLRIESDFASVVAIYEGATLADLNVISSCVSPECAEVNASVTKGTVLRIAVDGVGTPEPAGPAIAVGETGAGVLHWTFQPAAASALAIETAAM